MPWNHQCYKIPHTIFLVSSLLLEQLLWLDSAATSVPWLDVTDTGYEGIDDCSGTTTFSRFSRPWPYTSFYHLFSNLTKVVSSIVSITFIYNIDCSAIIYQFLLLLLLLDFYQELGHRDILFRLEFVGQELGAWFLFNNSCLTSLLFDLKVLCVAYPLFPSTC